MAALLHRNPIFSHGRRLGTLALFALVMALPSMAAPSAAVSGNTTGGTEGAPGRRSGIVRVQDHSLVDDGGPFLGLGATYFTALWQCKNDRKHLERELAFLSEQGFNYIRILSMVGWNPSWEGQEIAPVAFKNANGKEVAAWPDYWQQFRELVDLAYDRYGLRTQITIFADAQMMPERADRIAHLRNVVTHVVEGREEKVILLEVANEGWQNGFPGAQGLTDMREFAIPLTQRTRVPVAITSNHMDPFATVYGNSEADIATWHFSRDIATDEGWKPVYDCWDLGVVKGMPPVSSNEPIGPGSSVHSQTDPVRLVMAAAFAYVARLPMYVFHSGAGVRGMTGFETLPGIQSFRPLLGLLPGDLANWERNNGKEPRAPFTAYAGGQANRYCADVPDATDGCVRNTGSRKGDNFVCVPIGIREDGLRLRARQAMRFVVYNPLTGKVAQRAVMKAGDSITLPRGPEAYIIKGTIVQP